MDEIEEIPFDIIKYPIPFDKLILSHTQLGGAPEDFKSLLCFLNNVYYNTLTAITKNIKIQDGIIVEEDKNFTFLINNDVNDGNRTEILNNSSYIGHGNHSSTICIKETEPNEFIKEPLVLKVLFVWKHGVDYLKKWNDKYYSTYRKFKSEYRNLVPNCYYYGNEIIKKVDREGDMTHDCIDKPNDYYFLFEKKTMAYNIFKFYKTDIEDISKKKNLINTIVAVYVYLTNNNCYISDYKLANIAFDKTMTLIDYSTDLFQKNKIGDDYIYEKWIYYTTYVPCYLRKKLFLLIKDEIYNITLKLKLEQQRIKEIQDGKKLSEHELLVFVKEENKKIHDLLRNKINAIPDTVNNEIYKSKIDMCFDKMNSISIVEIILEVFFKSFYVYHEGERIKKNIKALFFYDKIFREDNDNDPLIMDQIDYPYYTNSGISVIGNYKNSNNIDNIKKFIEFIEPRYDLIDTNNEVLHYELNEYIKLLKNILFDFDSETGLLSPDYENVPPGILIFRLLNEGENYNEKYKSFIHKNIGEDVDDSLENPLNSKTLNYIGQDIIQELGLSDKEDITLDDWREARKREQLKARPENRSYENLFLPPTNSRFPQINNIDSEKLKKWNEYKDTFKNPAIIIRKPLIIYKRTLPLNESQVNFNKFKDKFDDTSMTHKHLNIFQRTFPLNKQPVMVKDKINVVENTNPLLLNGGFKKYKIVKL